MRARVLSCGLLLALGGSLAGLAIAEIGLRLFLPQPLLRDPDAFLPDPVLGARLKPGYRDRVVTTEFASTWEINEDGYRGPRRGQRRASGGVVAAVGDSFTFGYGVEEEQAWPRRLESILNEGTASRIEVANLGVGGYGARQEGLWLDEMLPAVQPELVVLAYYVGNDPADDARERARAGAGQGSAEAAGGGPARTEQLKRWLGARLHLYSFVSTRADEALVRIGLRRLVYPFEVDVLRRDPPAVVEEAWEASSEALAGLATLSRQAGFRLLVAVVPMKHQVSDAAWGRLLEHYRGLGGGGSLDRDRPQRVMAGLCAKARIACLDLLPGLRREASAIGDGSALYWPRDQHWNAQGHAAAARLIGARLREEGLVTAGRIRAK